MGPGGLEMLVPLPVGLGVYDTAMTAMTAIQRYSRYIYKFFHLVAETAPTHSFVTIEWPNLFLLRLINNLDVAALSNLRSFFPCRKSALEAPAGMLGGTKTSASAWRIALSLLAFGLSAPGAEALLYRGNSSLLVCMVSPRLSLHWLHS